MHDLQTKDKISSETEFPVKRCLCFRNPQAAMVIHKFRNALQDTFSTLINPHRNAKFFSVFSVFWLA